MGIRISEMEEATTFGADDYVPIVTNGTNKKALGQKIKDFIAGFFVSKSGDTMTGDLTVENTSNASYFISKSNNVTLNTSTTNNVTAQQVRGVRCYDSNNARFGVLQAIANTDGSIQFRTSARNMLTNGNFAENYIDLTMKKDGTREYTVADAAAFRKAIGLDTLFKRIRFSATYSINANAELILTPTNFNFSVPSGYTTLALYAYTTGNTNVIVRNIYAECNMTIKNLSSNNLSNISAQIDVIFVKSELM